MRPTWACIGLLATSLAAAAPANRPQRKPATEQYPADALSAFVDAIIADKEGDLETAERRYDSSSRTSPQPNTFFNLADVYRRMEKLPKAIEAYKKYLELAPKAADRRDVEHLIEALGSTPGSAVIDGEDLDAVVLLDGKLLGPSPVVVRPAAGKHVVDRVGPTTFNHRFLDLKPMRTEHLASFASRSDSGNVVLSGMQSAHVGRWRDKEQLFDLPGRFALTPGHYETFLGEADRACSPIVFDAPSAPGDVVYVFVDTPEKAPKGGCLPIKVRTVVLHLPPPPAVTP